MHSSSNILFLFLSLFSLFSFSIAARVPFKVRIRHSPSSNLQSRATNSSASSNIPILNTRNAEYISNITLNGRTIPVLLDTGSSDLWVTGDVPSTKDTGKSTSLNYAVGTAKGDINTANLEFAGYSVNDQAYLLVKNTSTFSVDIKAQGFEGLIGLGPNSGSEIMDELDWDNGSGDSVLSRIFSQNATTNNYLTMMLDRQGDPASNLTGQLTISELIPGFEKVTTMPQLSVKMVHKLTDEDQHWQTLTDKDGVIGPDGQAIQVKSIVPSAPSGQLVVVFDSGYTLPQVPRAMSDAIYGRVKGAEYNEQMQAWTVPCDQLINLSFKFGGIEYPIHPLDVSSSDFNMIDKLGNPVCLGAFQPITSAFSLLGEYDIILGMGFMRNAYSLFEYGNWVKDSSVDRKDPYVQLLPLTDKTAAHTDFVNQRLSGVDTSGDAAHALLPADQMQHSPISSSEKKKMYAEKILSRWPYIFVGCFIFLLLCIGLITWRCCVARKRRLARRKAAKMGIDTATSANAMQQSDTKFPASPSAVHLKPMGQYAYEEDPYAASYSPHYPESKA